MKDAHEPAFDAVNVEPSHRLTYVAVLVIEVVVIALLFLLERAFS